MFLNRLIHFVTCREASELLSQQQDRPLSGRERLRLRFHLTICNACSRFARQLAFVRAAMRAYRM
ncbi:MAG: zf-HC2 domain-containing protein [Pseudomonadota bacterium]|nr:zf-HC2 domain-containing protein [Pseudomonadota bacterium]